MTGLLWAAVGLTAAVAAASFGLTLVMARRLRELRERVDQLGQLDVLDLPEVDEPVPDFEATTTDGAHLDARAFAGADVLMLFLSGDCESCRELAAELPDMIAAGQFASAPPIAVVIGAKADAALMVGRLEPIARVVAQTDHFGLAARFGVRGFPSVLIAGGGVIRATGHHLNDLRAGMAA